MTLRSSAQLLGARWLPALTIFQALDAAALVMAIT